MTAQPAVDIDQVPAAPPLEPDPDLIDNAEGNDKIRREDRASAVAEVERLREANE